MGKTNYKGLRIDYQPGQKVKVMLGRDWFDAEVVKANKKTVIVNTLFSKTKYRRVQIDQSIEGSLGKPTSVLEPYTVSGTKIVKLPRVRVKPIEGAVVEEATPSPSAVGGKPTSGLDSVAGSGTVVAESAAPSPEYEGPGLGKDEAPFDPFEGPDLDKLVGKQLEVTVVVDEPKAESKPETAADVLAELEKMLE